MAFPIYPRERFFNSVGMKDLIVTEVGNYSTTRDGNSLKFGCRSKVPELNPLFILDPDESKLVKNCDLNIGFTVREVYRPTREWGDLDTLWMWTKNSGMTSWNAIRPDVDFICSKGILGELLKTLYKRDDKFIPKAYAFGAAIVEDKVLIGYITREDMEFLFEMTAPRTVNYDLSRHRGTRFEEIMTTAPGTNPVKLEEHRSVTCARLKDLTIIMENRIDAISPHGSTGEPCYIDLTLLPNFRNNMPNQFFGDCLLRWWTTNVFSTVKDLYVGIHEKGHVLELVRYPVQDIPAKLKAEDAANGFKFPFDADTSLAYLHDLLHFVRENVLKSADEAVYEFRCEIPVAENERKNMAFVCSEIPRSEARGHNYLPTEP